MLVGEESRWASQRMFSPSSAAKALEPPAPAPDAERLKAAGLWAAQIVREVVDQFGLDK